MTRDGYVYLVWDQARLDEYAGMKDAKPSFETVQAVFDGECYGYTVRDTDESCGGFIGNISYMESEIKSACKYLRNQADIAAASKMEQSRSDMYERNN